MNAFATEWNFNYAKQMYQMGLGLVFNLDQKTGVRSFAFEKIEMKDGTRRLVETGTIEFRHDVIPVFERKV